MKIDFKKLIGMERCVVLQAIAEGYLLRTTGKHFSDEFPNVKEEYGVLVEEHLKLLKDYLSEQYTSRNLDLNEFKSSIFQGGAIRSLWFLRWRKPHRKPRDR